MIPCVGGLIEKDFTVEEQPSKTYKMYDGYIRSTCDELEAMRQAIYKILNTERYQYIIYSWNYGIETMDLFGEPVTYACPEIKRRIMEALTQDTRITSVDAFNFNIEKGKIHVSFTVHTICGDAEAGKEVIV